MSNFAVENSTAVCVKWLNGYARYTRTAGIVCLSFLSLSTIESMVERDYELFIRVILVLQILTSTT